jgi:Tn3 transposase DDE domain-containing protein
VIFYGKDGDLTGPDREDAETSMLALHLLQSALVHVNTLLVQTVLEAPAFHDRMGTDERRGRGVDVLERALDDLDLGEAGQRQRRLAGGAPDLQQPVIRAEPSGSDHRLVQLLGVLRPGLLVEIRG